MKASSQAKSYSPPTRCWQSSDRRLEVILPQVPAVDSSDSKIDYTLRQTPAVDKIQIASKQLFCIRCQWMMKFWWQARSYFPLCTSCWQYPGGRLEVISGQCAVDNVGNVGADIRGVDGGLLSIQGGGLSWNNIGARCEIGFPRTSFTFSFWLGMS